MNTDTPVDGRPSCSRCAWWRLNSSVTGHCKRNPPAAHFEDGCIWPMTGRADWCGEYIEHQSDADRLVDLLRHAADKDVRKWRPIETVPLGVKVEVKMRNINGTEVQTVLVAYKQAPDCILTWWHPDGHGPLLAYPIRTHWRPVVDTSADQR